eukprot:3737096-Prymnesium_polylepis.1
MSASERYWFPNLSGEMDEWYSDSELDDEDTLDNMYYARMDALLYGDVEFEDRAYEVEQQRRKQAARWRAGDAAPCHQEWLRLAYDQALFKDGGRGAVAAKVH